MEKKEAKIGFFKRFKKAIFELEDYGYFLGETLTDAFKYFFTLAFVVSLIFSIVITFKITDVANKANSYIVNELPDLEFKENNLNFNTNISAYDEEYNFSFLVDTTENLSEEEVKSYKDKVYSQGGYGLVLLKDKMVMISNATEDTTKYSEYFFTEDNTSNENIIKNKQDLVSLFEGNNYKQIIISIFITILISVYFLNLMVLLRDVCVVGIFGWLASRFCGVNFKINPMLALSIYGLTLSVVLDLIFDIIYVTTGFASEYFGLLYLLIAYVYIIAAIFMIKYDLIKHTEELKRILEVQKEVKKDLDDDKIENKEEKDEIDDKADTPKIEDEDKEKTNEKKEEKPEENKEPDGSEI